MYLTQNLRRAVQQRPQAIASVYRGRKRSFAELGARVARLAGVLRRLGVQPGDRVAMLGLNSDWYLEYYPGVYWSGGVVNPINTRWSVAEIAYSLEDCQSGVLLVDENFTSMVGELRQRCPSLHTVLHVADPDCPTPEGMLPYEELMADAEPLEDALRGGEDLAGVFYTGGTTGVPKGVMLSHRNLYTNSLVSVAEGIARPGSVGLHSAPMFHLADGCFMNALFACAGTHVMVPRFAPLDVFEAIQEAGVTDTMLVPTMLQMMVDHPDIGQWQLGSLRGILYGASPMNEELLERAMRALPQVRFIQAYGMTELSPVATVLPPDMHLGENRKRGLHRSNGRAAMGCEVRIVDGEDREVPLGEVGEIVVRGPGVMMGYWNKPEATEEALRGGWMHTGDGGRMDENGLVYVVDRLKDMIITGGENVYSLEVENAIASHPLVAMCAVIGVPDAQWGEAVHAFVLVREDAPRAADPQQDAQSIIEHCKTLIAGYKCPRTVSFIDAMPLSGAGKILKTTLRAPFWQGQGKQVA